MLSKTTQYVALALAAAAAAGALTAAVERPRMKPDVEYLNPYGPSAYPFSSAVRVGNLLILSGELGRGADGRIVPGGIVPETRQTMENIKETLTRCGSSLDRVVKCTVMLADMKEWPAMNEVYAAYFPKNKPARSALGVSGLALGARVEIECWAAIP